MKILHIITAVKRGGAENHLYALSVSQQRKGHDVSIICLKREDYWEKALVENGVDVFYVETSTYLDITAVVRLSNLIQDLSPDLVHAHLTPAELFTRLALFNHKLKELPLVISKHNDSKFCNFWGQSTLGKWVAQRANRVIAISRSVRDNNCVKNLSIPKEKVSVINYGIDPTPYEGVSQEKIKSLRAEWSVNDGDYLIGVVARLIPQKSLDTLLDGFKIYRQKSKLLSRLVIVGVGPLEKNLKKRAHDIGIQDDVIWAGFREDIPVVMNTIDVFALTSKFEGLGLVLLEAMAAGKPIVASRVSAIPEVIEDMKTGILFDPGDFHKLASALILLEDSVKKNNFSKASIRAVRSKFSLNEMTNKTLDVYKCLT